MSLLYSIKEAFAGFAKARISTAATIFTVFFLLLILALVAAVSLNMDRLVTVLNADHDVQVFLANTLNESEIQQLRLEILAMTGVTEVQYISKEKAADDFKREFGQDIFDALEENPLPASFIINVKDDNQTGVNIERLSRALQGRLEIDDIVMHQGVLDVLIKFARVSRLVLYVLLVVVLAGSLFMISNTIRLIILAREHIVNTMKLVGATDAFIRRPFVIEGMLQGLVGGLLTAVFMVLLIKGVNWQWPGLVMVPPIFYLVVLLAGSFLGLVGSLLAIRRFL